MTEHKGKRSQPPPDEVGVQTVTASFTSDEYRIIRAVADARGVSIEDFMYEAIVDKLDETRSRAGGSR